MPIPIAGPVTFLLGGSGGGGGIAEAPTDGQTYGRDNSAWVPAVNKSGDTMTGTLVVSDPNATLNTYLEVWDPNNQRGVKLTAYPQLIIQGVPGVSVQLESSRANFLSMAANAGLCLGEGQTNTVTMQVNQTTGDVILSCIGGTNNGKSVNLTTGKWV